jgi:cytidylate kinase
MSVITISRGSYSRGKEIAEKVASELGFDCVSREVLLKASSEFNVPEAELIHALENEPTFFERFTHKKEKYISYIQTGVLKQLKRDNVVYHGLAGHFFVKDVSHVLKVRIIAELDDRIGYVMYRDRVSRKEARRLLRKIDNQRKKWSQHLYGINTLDPSLYDLVLHVNKLSVDDAVNVIVHTVRLKAFQTTAESQKAIDDLYLASLVRANLLDVKYGIKVTADGGDILVKAKVLLSEEKRVVQTIIDAAKTIPGVKDVVVKTELDPREPYD